MFSVVLVLPMTWSPYPMIHCDRQKRGLCSSGRKDQVGRKVPTEGSSRKDQNWLGSGLGIPQEEKGSGQPSLHLGMLMGGYRYKGTLLCCIVLCLLVCTLKNRNPSRVTFQTIFQDDEQKILQRNTTVKK